MVKIGNVELSNAAVQFQNGSITVRFNSEMSYAELEETFSSAKTVEIINASKDELYYVTNLMGMSRGNGLVSMTFEITKVGPDIANELRDSIDDADEALVELAEMAYDNAEQIASIWEYLHEKFPESEEVTDNG